MEVSISRSMTPEMERAVQAVKELSESGEMDLSSVITPYDILFLIVFAIIAIPLFITCVNGLTSCFTASKKVKSANAILDALSTDDTPQGVDMDAILEALSHTSSRPTTRPRKVGSTNKQFDAVTRQIQKALELQRRNSNAN